MDKHLEDYENRMRDIISEDNKKEYKKEYKSMTKNLKVYYKRLNPTSVKSIIDDVRRIVQRVYEGERE